MTIISNRYSKRRKVLRRKPLDIINDLLESIKNKPDIKKTRLMYKANLSHQALEKYLLKMQKSGLIKILPESFEITTKGKQVLTEYVKMKDFLESFGLE